jgi:tetrapyrrole methylase family protein/MazG family protein
MTINQISDSELGKFQTLIEIVGRLRSPAGCPWDMKQTNKSLKRYLLEECYEALEAIDSGDPQALSEEMGDILTQIAFCIQISQELGDFDLADVLTKVNQKLIRRHPHVFGDTTVVDVREVERNWEGFKAAERRLQNVDQSVVNSVPIELPALAYAQLMQDRVSRVGFDWEDLSGVLDKIVEEAEELRRAATEEEREHELGDLLFSVVNLGRWLGVHSEDALRQANQRFRQRYICMEKIANSRGQDFDQLPLAAKESLWQEAKKSIG